MGPTREELELALVRSYEELVHLKRRALAGVPGLEEDVRRELQLQRYLHALLGCKGVPPGLL